MSLVAILALLAVGPVFAADPSLALVLPGQAGLSRLLLDPGVYGPIAAIDLAVLVGNGGAHPTAVTPFGADPVYTAIAFDASGSFRSHLPVSIASAKVFSGALPPTSRTAVFTFGAQLSDLGEGSGPAVGALLDHAQDSRPEKVTRLKSLVSEVVDRVAQRQEGPGLRQVVLFTDAGEESTVYSLDDLVANARQRGVQVHVVDFAGAGGRQAATRLDEMKALAERTGGAHLDGRASRITTLLADVARAPQRLVWVDVAYCAVSAPTHFVQDKVQVEIRRGSAPYPSTGKVDFSQEVGGAATAACEDPPASTDPPAQGTSPPPVAASGGFPRWAFAIAGLGLVGMLTLLGITAVALRGRGQPAQKAPARLAPTPAQAPATAARARTEDHVVVPPPPDPSDPFVTLPPETQLTVQSPHGGLIEPYYRLTKRETVFGASRETDVEVDLPRISGRHAKFELFPTGAVWVTDLDSSNGTFVDGRRLAPNERVRLSPGAIVGLSQQLEMRLRQPSRDAVVIANPGPALPSPIGAAVGVQSPPPPPNAAPARKVAKTIFQNVGASPVSGPAGGPPPPSPSSPPGAPSADAPRRPARTLFSPSGED